MNIRLFGLTFLTSSYLIAQGFVYPVGDPNQRPDSASKQPNGYRIIQSFMDDSSGHTGVDLGNGTSGGEVRAIGAGVVTISLDSSQSAGFGNVVLIKHELVDGIFYSLYAHLQDGSVLVNQGDIVQVGQPIGLVDSTGHVFGPHLHFTIKTMNAIGCGYITQTFCTKGDTFSNYVSDPLQFIANHEAPTSAPLTGTLSNITFANSAALSGSFGFDPASGRILNSTVVVTDPLLGPVPLADAADSSITIHTSGASFTEVVLVNQKPTGTCTLGAQCGATYVSLTVPDSSLASFNLSKAHQLICAFCDQNPIEEVYTSRVIGPVPTNFKNDLLTPGVITISANPPPSPLPQRRIYYWDYSRPLYTCSATSCATTDVLGPNSPYVLSPGPITGFAFVISLADLNPHPNSTAFCTGPTDLGIFVQLFDPDNATFPFGLRCLTTSDVAGATPGVPSVVTITNLGGLQQLSDMTHEYRLTFGTRESNGKWTLYGNAHIAQNVF